MLSPIVNMNDPPEAGRATLGEEILDIYIDTQYAVANCLPEDYAKCPWEFAQDALYAFTSIRFSKRADFLALAHRENPSQHARIVEELDRIRQQRANFASDPHKRDLMDDLNKSRRNWRSEVIQNRPRYERQVQGSGGWRRIERRRRDLELLARIAAWPIVTQEEAESLPPPRVEPFYGMKASLVCFKRQGTEWRPWDVEDPRCRGKFPHQEIRIEDVLADTEDSLLRQRSSKDEIRWFHFPANSMRWIEVGTFPCTCFLPLVDH